jgi:hypothetical protein
MHQPDCQPVLELMRRWRLSQQETQPRRPVTALTQQQFEALTPKELGILLRDVFIVRDGVHAPS